MYKISNVKLSLKIQYVCLDTVQKQLELKSIKYKSYNNFIVFKNVYTFILFKSKDKERNHLNVTNIKTVEDRVNVIEVFKISTLGDNISILSVNIDNITASFKILKTFNFTGILNKFVSLAKVTYNSEKFPGVFLKFDCGTVILFHTGNCIIIGCKVIENIQWLMNQIHVNI